MVRELEMDHKTRLNGQASSVPAWLLDPKASSDKAPPRYRGGPIKYPSASSSDPGATTQSKDEPDDKAQRIPSGDQDVRIPPLNVMLSATQDNMAVYKEQIRIQHSFNLPGHTCRLVMHRNFSSLIRIDLVG